jgi:hypothetical protein
MSKGYRFAGVMLVTGAVAYLAAKSGAQGWELGAVVLIANAGLQMMAGMSLTKWSDTS